VKIGSDERTGWSSERPRRDGAPPRPADVSVRSRVLRPSHRLRYSPGSLLVVVGAVASEPDQFVERVVEEQRNAVPREGPRTAGRTGRGGRDRGTSPRAVECRAALKRLKSSQTVVVAIAGFDAEERERYVRLAHGERRPRHLILLETPRNQVLEEERPALDELRRALDAGELGLEGFQTAPRLGGNALSELKRIVFQPPPRED
jgi:hypothetical protein